MQTNLNPHCYDDTYSQNCEIRAQSNISLMDREQTFEEIALSIANLDRQEVTQRILGFKGRFCMDFTPDYLENLSIDRLRHILLAALTTQLRRYRR